MKHPSCMSRRASLAVVVLAAAPLALAQTDQTAEQAVENVEQGVEEAVQEGEEALESAGQAVEEELDEMDLEEAALAEGEPVEGQIILQGENTILAEDLVGLTVYSPAEETIGEIDDLIVNFDGNVEGVVIGVGGFLGIGEKAVAIEMQALELSSIDADEMRLVLSTSREELEAAPGFVSVREQEAAAEAAAVREQLEQGVGTTTALPTEPVDPADAVGTVEAEPAETQ